MNDTDTQVAVIEERQKRFHEDNISLRQEVARLTAAVSELAQSVASIRPINVLLQSGLAAALGGTIIWIITKK